MITNEDDIQGDMNVMIDLIIFNCINSNNLKHNNNYLLLSVSTNHH